MGFFTELKCRNVVRLGLAYAKVRTLSPCPTLTATKTK